ncbi:cytochrome P450 [Cladorrhinum sp. PSN332]|nr:cytochrome P450 [Cladorrhinum sp. PSN332]
MGIFTSLQVLDLTACLLLLSAAIPIFLLTQIVYNLYFHPLRHIPGPFWARASSIPSWLQARTGKRHLWLHQQFQLFNTNTLRVEPNVVVFQDPEAYSAIYGEKSNVQRSDFYKMWSRNADDINTMNALESAEHARKRKILNRCFTDKSLRSAATFITKHVDRWNELLISPETPPNEWSSPVDLSERLDALVLDILTDLCFGQSVLTKEPDAQCPNPSLKSIPHCISEYLKLYYPLCRSPFASLLIWLKPRGLDHLFALITPPAIKQYYAFVESSATSRLSQPPDAPERLDMFHFLTTAPDKTTTLTLKELLAESHLLIIAGSDTTSITLSGLFFYLTSPSNLEPLQKLTAEIRSAFSSLSEIVYPSPLLMTNCKHLTRCINEALRLVNPLMCEIPREVRPGGITIQGRHYPAGTIVGYSPFVTAHDTQIWGPDASKYRPERWETATKEMRAAYHPFLSGPGNCAGRSLALSEMYMTVARMLWQFDVRRTPGSNKGAGGPGKGLYGPAEDEEHFNLFDAFVSLKEGPEVQFRRRQV